MDRAFKGVWIPKEIWLSTDLTLQEKVFLVEIDSLDNENGCYASNKHFSDFFQLSKNRCSEVIKSLENKKLITITYIKENGKKNIDKRVIRVVGKQNRGIRKIDIPIRKSEEGYSENSEDNNTVFNNTFNNTKEYIPFVEIINYLNSVAHTNYRSSTKATQRVIKARWNEGFKIQDFKKVIDKKSAEWLNDPKMNKFLRPETLFGTKFESYLNQKGGGQAASNRQRIGTDDETKSKIRETNERRKRIARVKSDTDSDLPF